MEKKYIELREKGKERYQIVSQTHRANKFGNISDGHAFKSERVKGIVLASDSYPQFLSLSHYYYEQTGGGSTLYVRGREIKRDRILFYIPDPYLPLVKSIIDEYNKYYEGCPIPDELFDW